MKSLDELVHEREPSVEQLERERLIRTKPYRYGDFYEPFEKVVLGAIEATIWRARRDER